MDGLRAIMVDGELRLCLVYLRCDRDGRLYERRFGITIGNDNI